jgi:GT2 family glycosyltransferase
MARGDIIGLLNSDDYYEPHTLQTIADASREHPGVGIFYGLLRILLRGKELQVYRYRYENYLLDLEMGVYAAAQHPTCFVRRAVYRQIGVFDTSFSIAADYDFLIRAMKSGIEFLPLDAVLSNYRLGGASDRMSDHERLKQRNAVLYKNGLLSEEEHLKRQKRMRYTKYRALKQRLAQLLFGI